MATLPASPLRRRNSSATIRAAQARILSRFGSTDGCRLTLAGQCLPSLGRRDGAAELFRSDEGFDPQPRRTIAGLPIRAAPSQGPAPHARAQVGPGALGQDQAPARVDPPTPAPIPLGPRPADPLVAGLAVPGRRVAAPAGHPAALGIDRGIVERLAHWLEDTQIGMRSERALKASARFGFGAAHDADLGQQSWRGRNGQTGRRFFRFHAPEGKKAGGRGPAKSASALLFKPPVPIMHTR